MTSQKTLAIIALVALLVGLAFTLFGFWLYVTNPPFQPESSDVTGVPVGFVFCNSENLTNEETYFKLYLENVTCTAGTIEVELIMLVVCQEMNNSLPFHNEDSIFFSLQIPSDISDVEVNYRGWDREPQFYGGNFQILNTTELHSDLSAILVEIPKEHFTYGKTELLVFSFTMKNVFSKVDAYMYQRAITFSSSFDDTLRDSLWQRRIVTDNPAVFRFLYKAELYVEEPINFNSQLVPLPHGIHYSSNHTLYSWDIKATATTVGSDSIIIEFEDIPTKNDSIFLDNFMWLLLGIGIPMSISSFIEFLREDGLNQIGVFKSFKSASNRNSRNMVDEEENNPQDEDKSKELTYDELILSLIQKIEDKKSELFRARDFFKSNWQLFVMIVVLAMFFVSLFIVAMAIYFFGSTLGTNLLAVILAFFSTSLALVSSTYAMYHFIIGIAEKSIVELNFEIVAKGVEDEDQRVLLKALIKIKSKNKDIDLKRIYTMNKDLFTKEKLAEKLCE